jgi:hypothetical protein
MSQVLEHQVELGLVHTFQLNENKMHNYIYLYDTSWLTRDYVTQNNACVFIKTTHIFPNLPVTTSRKVIVDKKTVVKLAAYQQYKKISIFSSNKK